MTFLLAAVNSLRAAGSMGPLTWAAILPPGTAAPADGGTILAAHVTAFRDAMDQARSRSAS